MRVDVLLSGEAIIRLESDASRYICVVVLRMYNNLFSVNYLCLVPVAEHFIFTCLN